MSPSVCFNATFDGRLAMAHAGETKEDSNQIVTFSGAESKLNFEAGTAFANQGIDVRFDGDADSGVQVVSWLS